MSCTITLNKTFEVELEDNTTINVMLCLEASTEDEDYQASRQIRTFNYDNVIIPLQGDLIELLMDIPEDDEDEDPEDDGGMSDLLTAEDPQCAQ
jgi:hypothetical protein